MHTQLCFLFADDCLLYRHINSLADSHALQIFLQSDLNKLQKWESMWQMEFNPDKCEVLRITLNTNRIITGTYLIHCKVLNLVPSAKYLGITIDSKLMFNEHVDNICKKANTTRAFISRNTKNVQSKSMLWRKKILYAHSWSMRPLHGSLTPNVTLIKSKQCSVVLFALHQMTGVLRNRQIQLIS